MLQASLWRGVAQVHHVHPMLVPGHHQHLHCSIRSSAGVHMGHAGRHARRVLLSCLQGVLAVAGIIISGGGSLDLAGGVVHADGLPGPAGQEHG